MHLNYLCANYIWWWQKLPKRVADFSECCTGYRPGIRLWHSFVKRNGTQRAKTSVVIVCYQTDKYLPLHVTFVFSIPFPPSLSLSLPLFLSLTTSLSGKLERCGCIESDLKTCFLKKVEWCMKSNGFVSYITSSFPQFYCRVDTVK